MGVQWSGSGSSGWRSAVAVAAAAAMLAGMLLAREATGARASGLGQAAGTGLPNPGPLLPAPRSLAAAEKEIAPVLTQMQHPKTALLGTVRLLVNSGVSILNGPKTVFRGRRGGPPMFMQAGAVVALSQDIAGPSLDLAQLLKIYGASNVARWQMGLTPAFFGRNFASEITGASDASEYLWSAALIGADTSTKGLVASLKGAGIPADALVPLQVQLLSLRLQVDALATAYEFRSKHATAALPAAPASVPCNIDNIPEWLNSVATSVYNHGIDETIRHGGFGDLAEKYAERYGKATSIASIAGTVINAAILLFAMKVTTTPKPNPIERTTSTTSDGKEAIISTSFSWPTDNYEWLNCARLILNATGFDDSVPSKIIKNAEVTWSLDKESSTAARLIIDTAKTNADGIARTVITGLRQPFDLGTLPIRYTRVLGLTASINPRSARSAADLLATDTITAIEGIYGAVTQNYIGAIDAILKLAVSWAEEAGVLRRGTPINMIDYIQFPVSFSASMTITNDVNWEGDNVTSKGPLTVPKNSEYLYTGDHSAYYATNMTGTVVYTNIDGCGGTYPIAWSQVDIGLVPGYQWAWGSAGWNPSCGGEGIAFKVLNASNKVWSPGQSTTTLSIVDPNSSSNPKAVIGSITIHWYYN